MAREDLKFSCVVDHRALETAIRVNAALGGRTNAVLHLTALAGRLGIKLTLDDFEENCAGIPLLANIVPNGEFLVEEFFRAGGVPAIMSAVRGRIHLDAVTVSGRASATISWASNRTDARVIAPIELPIKPESAVRILRGNLAPSGAIIKPSAASPALMRHVGRAVVFECIEDLDARIDQADLDVDASSVLVLKRIGPRGYPGMPELGNIRIPAKLLLRGVTDTVRISDGRMSGTAYGIVVLHVSPESAVGGPLALVRTGDLIELDVACGVLHLHVTEAELTARRAAWKAEQRGPERGYENLFVDHVTQAHEGIDFDFLAGESGRPRLRDGPSDAPPSAEQRVPRKTLRWARAGLWRPKTK
jgi:dihydroxy-acid dehydratase